MALGIERVGAIRLFVHDLAQAREFYADTLQLPDRLDGEAFSAFRIAGVDIVVEVAAGDQANLAGRFTGVSLAVSDVDVAVDRLRRAGVVVTGSPEKQSWGGTLAHIADPDGNELTLVQYPSGTDG